MAAQNDDTAWMMEYIRHVLPSDIGDWEHRLKDADDDFDLENENGLKSWLEWSVSVERFASPNQNNDAIASNNQELDLTKTSNGSVQNVPWQQATPSLTQEAIDDLFPIKSNPISQKKVANANQKTPSALSQQLGNLSPTHENAFGAYCHYDGRGITDPARSRRRRTCRFRVFVRVEPTNPIIYYDVVVLASAEVHHVIGLACWLYTQDNQEPLLKSSVEEYDIVIAEEDGTPEELPPLDRQSSITRYDFKFLAVVPRRSRNKEHSSEETPLRVILPDGSAEIRLKIEQQSVTVAEIIEKATEHVPKTIDFDFEYELMSNDIILAKDEKIGEWKRRLFYLVRAHSKYVASNRNLITTTNEKENNNLSSLAAFEAHIYREFSVFLHWRGHTPATLCISANKLDVLPKDMEKAESLFKTGLASLDMIQVTKTEIKHARDDWCIVKVNFEKEAKSRNSCKLKFECDPSTAEAIKSKLDALRQIIDVTQTHSSSNITESQSTY